MVVRHACTEVATVAILARDPWIFLFGVGGLGCHVCSHVAVQQCCL